MNIKMQLTPESENDGRMKIYGKAVLQGGGGGWGGGGGGKEEQ